MRVGHLLALGVVIVAAAAVGLFIYKLSPVRPPAVSGRHGIAAQALALVSDTDATPIARIWYPTDDVGDHGQDGPAVPPAAGARLPVLVYIPSWSGTAIEDVYFIRDLVSQGFVVATLRYPSASETAADPRLRTEPPGGMDFSSAQAFEDTVALGDRKVRARARNVSALLDQLTRLDAAATGPFSGRLDLDHIGTWGFSLGGAAAAQAAWLDRRIKAVVNLDGWLFADASTEGVPCPYLLLSDASLLPDPADFASADPVTRHTAIFNQRDYDRQTAGMTRYGGFLVSIDGTTHINFSDAAVRFRARRLTGAGALDPNRSFGITAAYLRGFFEAYLLARPSVLFERNAADYPEAHLLTFGPGNAGRS